MNNDLAAALGKTVGIMEAMPYLKLEEMDVLDQLYFVGAYMKFAPCKCIRAPCVSYSALTRSQAFALHPGAPPQAPDDLSCNMSSSSRKCRAFYIFDPR